MSVKKRIIYLAASLLLFSTVFDRNKFHNLGLYHYSAEFMNTNFRLIIFLNALFAIFLNVYTVMSSHYGQINSAQYLKIMSYFKLEGIMLLNYLYMWDHMPFYHNKKELLVEIFLWTTVTMIKKLSLEIYYGLDNTLEAGSKAKGPFVLLALTLFNYEVQKFLPDFVQLKGVTITFLFINISQACLLNLLALTLYFKQTNLYKNNVYIKISCQAFNRISLCCGYLWLVLLYFKLLVLLNNHILSRFYIVWFITEVRELLNAKLFFNLTTQFVKSEKVTFDLNKQSSQTCSICLEQIERAVMLKCGHYFHVECFESLIYNNQNHKCPYCGEQVKFAMPNDDKEFYKEKKGFLTFRDDDTTKVNKILELLNKS